MSNDKQVCQLCGSLEECKEFASKSDNKVRIFCVDGMECLERYDRSLKTQYERGDR